MTRIVLKSIFALLAFFIQASLLFAAWLWPRNPYVEETAEGLGRQEAAYMALYAR
jgi:hypothetical protein